MKPLPEKDPGTPGHAVRGGTGPRASRGGSGAVHISPARYLLWLLRLQWRSCAAGAALGVVWMLSQALMPAAIGRALGDGVAARDERALLTWAGVLLALGVLQAVASAFRHRLAVFNWLAASYRTVQLVTRQATRLGGTLPKRLSTGEMMSIGLSDVVHIGGALDIISRGTGAVVAIIAVAGILLATSPTLGLIVLVGVPVILAVAAPLLRPYRDREREHRELVGELSTHAADLVAGLRVLRGIGGEAMFSGRYRAESQRVRRAGVAVARAETRLSGAEVLLPGLLVALVTWAGARFAVQGSIGVGELVTCYGYAVFLIIPLKTVGEAAGRITQALVAAGRVTALLAMEPELRHAGTARPEGPLHVTDVASGLVVRDGRVTAVAAADPRDAQAVADRLGRYVPGVVDFGGVPLHTVADVRRRVLVAVNEDRLFSGPLAESLAPDGDEDGDEDGDGAALRAAVHAACAEDVVDSVGLDAHVVEAGREFSGGQQQRLRLARALVADPDLLVLVEPTSAVDAHTEARIADRLGPARAGRTTVVCTTSPLMLDRADHVAFVLDGQVVAEGTHRDLLDTEPRYAATVTREEATAPVQTEKLEQTEKPEQLDPDQSMDKTAERAGT
ncbi:ABC transporter transmembrane domain-containing protein [Actinomadura livida]|uniref:ABC transporter ATP-binding protein n=1 Tax=Actinomadura livida TaxID=79909 RepID=A0A7W7IA96_9ACTN|nr:MULTISPECIES: ABC transporter ATP-binding protein [Actinomadura]MBB4773335.1 ABC-type multidrug transport system fused ATPase/permease subunit [Actinomadura catellatispora]GGU33486.1 ABC transporter [Actinomadura livida]